MTQEEKLELLEEVLDMDKEDIDRLPRLAARNRHRTPRPPSSYPARIASSMETLQGRDIYPPTRSGKKHGNIGNRLRTRTA